MIVFICNMSVNKEILAGWANVTIRASDKYAYLINMSISTIVP